MNIGDYNNLVSCIDRSGYREYEQKFIDQLFEDGVSKALLLKTKYEHEMFDLTCFRPYPYMQNKNKGALGEQFVSQFMRCLGHTVENPPTNTDEYDRIISGTESFQRVVSGILTEIKFSVMIEPNFIWNHIARMKRWQRLLLMGIVIPDYRISRTTFKIYQCWITKDDFIANSGDKESGKYFIHQQGGNEAKNDDYWLNGRKGVEIFKQSFVKDLKDW